MILGNEGNSQHKTVEVKSPTGNKTSVSKSVYTVWFYFVRF